MAEDGLPPSFGRYEVRGTLGAGGMGVVLRGWDPKLKREVAIKVLPKRLKTVPTFEERFQREALTLARVSHPNVVRIFDVGEEHGLFYYVMEYLQGTPLDKRADEREAKGLTEPPPFDAKEFLDTFTPLADALAAVHAAGVIHRDIKPANIMAGTGHYMAPEQVMGNAPDALCDIYALGAAMWEFATGRVPFGQVPRAQLLVVRMTAELKPLGEAAPQVPEAIAAVVNLCVKLKPQDRYQKARDLHRALTRVARGPAEGGDRPVSSASRSRNPAPTAVSGSRSALSATPLLPAIAATRTTETMAIPRNRWLPALILAAAALAGGLTGLRLRGPAAPVTPRAVPLVAPASERPIVKPVTKVPVLSAPPAAAAKPFGEPFQLTAPGEIGKRVAFARLGSVLVGAWVRPDGKVAVRRGIRPVPTWEKPACDLALTADPASNLAMVGHAERLYLLFCKSGPDRLPWVQISSTTASCESWSPPVAIGRAATLDIRLALAARDSDASPYPMLAVWSGPRGQFPATAWGTPDGAAWTSPSVLPGKRLESRLAAILPAAGRATLVWSEDNPANESASLIASQCPGPGQVWTEPKPLAIESAGFDRRSPVASIAGDRCYLLWTEDRVAAKPLTLGLSSDGGLTFRQIGPQVYPYCKDARAVMAAQDSRIWCAWFVNHLDEFVWVTSHDGGHSWTRPKALDARGKSSPHASLLVEESGSAWMLWSNSLEEVYVAHLP
ncbi:MAG: serine/threonine protein kinase [Candidatus Wallbacteria bacterium]|nr:serine/threonine protein kinase [Candidatus Wallbacteria bacterium]